MPKVSIVMPVYNGGRHFRSALESALAQTYENIEIVVVNDGSTDGGETEAIAHEHLSRIRYVAQDNKGVAGALNAGIAAMSGDFFAWLSHDDIHLPRKTARQVAFLEEIGKTDAILFSDYELIDQDGKQLREMRVPRDELIAAPALALLKGYINGCTVLIPREILGRFGPFDERLRYSQDYDLWNRILVEHEFLHQPEVLVQFRTHAGQDSHKPAAIAEADAILQRIVESRTLIERAQMYGSPRRYYAAVAANADTTPFRNTAAAAHAQIARVVGRTVVSVLIRVEEDGPLAVQAIGSVLSQTHQSIEVIVRLDGSAESAGPLSDLLRSDKRIRLVQQGAGDRRKSRFADVLEARGEYIAFLEPNARFAADKLSRQLALMQQTGELLSHTSYYVECPELTRETGLVKSGQFGGSVYPQIIAVCPINSSTVMVHRLLVAEGCALPRDAATDDDLIVWIDVAARHRILGIDEPLTTVRWPCCGARHSGDHRRARIETIIAELKKDPLHARQSGEIAALRSACEGAAGHPAAPDDCGGSLLELAFASDIVSLARSCPATAEHVS